MTGRRREVHAHQIPDDHLEMTADVVRLARAATPATKGADILDSMRRLYPEEDEARIKRAIGYAASMLMQQLDVRHAVAEDR